MWRKIDLKKVEIKYYILMMIIILNIIALCITSYSIYKTIKKIPVELDNNENNIQSNESV